METETTTERQEAQNGADAGSQQTSATAEQGEARDASETMRHAEEIVDRVAEATGYYVSVAGHALLKLASRAREEAEDIWAEAQHMRQNGRHRE